MNNTLVNGYIGLLNNLSLEEKLDLISRLSASAKQNIMDKKAPLKKLLVHLIQRNLLTKSSKKSRLAEFPPGKLSHFERVSH